MSSDGGAQCGSDRLQEVGVFSAKAARIAPVGAQVPNGPSDVGSRPRTAQQAMALHERRKNGVSGVVNVWHHHRVPEFSAARIDDPGSALIVTLPTESAFHPTPAAESDPSVRE